MMTVYVCIMFSGVRNKMVRIGDYCIQAGTRVSMYVELHKHLRNIWAIRYGAYIKNQRIAWALLLIQLFSGAWM